VALWARVYPGGSGGHSPDGRVEEGCRGRWNPAPRGSTYRQFAPKILGLESGYKMPEHLVQDASEQCEKGFH